MRIGFNARVLADAEVRGLSRYTVCLLEALSSIPEVELILFCKEPLSSNHVANIKARIVTFDARREILWNDVFLRRALKSERVDVFHAPADRGLPMVRVCPMVVTVHGWYERLQWRSLFPTTKGKLWYWKNEFAHYVNADAVVTVSNTARENLIRLGVAPPRRIHFTPLAPDRAFTPDPSPRDAPILERYEIQQPYVLNVGGYDPWKNVDALINAFNRSSLTDHLLVICGRHTRHYVERIPEWQTLHSFRNIRFLEPDAEDLPALYRHASFFVHPSLCESFGLPVVEAMASGCPVACAEGSSLPETAGSAALLFDPHNVEAMAKTLGDLGHDPGLRSLLRSKGFENIKRFSWAKTAEETMKIYTAVTRNS